MKKTLGLLLLAFLIINTVQCGKYSFELDCSRTIINTESVEYEIKRATEADAEKISHILKASALSDQTFRSYDEIGPKSGEMIAKNLITFVANSEKYGILGVITANQLSIFKRTSHVLSPVNLFLNSRATAKVAKNLISEFVCDVEQNHPEIKKIEAFVLDSRKDLIETYQDLRFVKEAALKDRVFFGNDKTDSIIILSKLNKKFDPKTIIQKFQNVAETQTVYGSCYYPSKYVIRSMKKEDAPKIKALVEAEISCSESHIITQDELTEEMLEDYAKVNDDDKVTVYNKSGTDNSMLPRKIALVAEETDGTFIGFASAEMLFDGNVARARHNFRLDYMLNPSLSSEKKEEIAKDLISTLTKKFLGSKAKRIETMVLETDEKSIELYKNIGFRQEGLMEERYVLNNGSVVGLIPMVWNNFVQRL